MKNDNTTKRLLNSMKKSSEQKIEGYKMNRDLLFKIKWDMIKSGNDKLANRANYRINTLDNMIAWESGLIAGFKISLSLIH